jgi:hypothetical protein
MTVAHSWTTLLPKSTSPGRPSWPGPFCLVLEFLLLLVRLNQVIRMLSNTGGLSIHASPMGHTLGAAEPALSPSGLVACPGAATLEESIRLLERRSDIGGEHGVVPAERNVSRLPALGDEMRRIFQIREPSAHVR